MARALAVNPSKRTDWMWCKRCQQDVAGYAGSAGGPVACARCGLALTLTNASDVQPHAPSIDAAAASGIDLGGGLNLPPADLDDWDLEDDLPTGEWSAIPESMPRWAFPPPPPVAVPVTAAPTPLIRADVPKSQGERGGRGGSSSTVAWGVLLVALMTFVCGAVLLIWSTVEMRPELWELGIPICGAGQIGLIVGLVLQLERVWQNSHWTAGKLQQVDEQLSDLKTSATLLSTTHSTPGVSFYAHMAEGASPQLLLADLKGQLDLLALRMADNRR